jgi:hypothetical protein
VTGSVFLIAKSSATTNTAAHRSDVRSLTKAICPALRPT